MTYAGNPENIAGLPANRVELLIGDICDAELLDRLVPTTTPPLDGYGAIAVPGS